MSDGEYYHRGSAVGDACQSHGVPPSVVNWERVEQEPAWHHRPSRRSITSCKSTRSFCGTRRSEFLVSRCEAFHELKWARAYEIITCVFFFTLYSPGWAAGFQREALGLPSGQNHLGIPVPRPKSSKPGLGWSPRPACCLSAPGHSCAQPRRRSTAEHAQPQPAGDSFLLPSPAAPEVAPCFPWFPELTVCYQNYPPCCHPKLSRVVRVACW